ncbi:MAG: YggS family pyridoxal phosphate-dependent enzyme [Candidatus Hydrogenedentes bacterium]|nr:YggS family pyridoxal phosphate-dependent enzyme [Candidatus Hydrogenedentota bacterium]
MDDTDTRIANNLDIVRRNIDRALARAGRPAGSVRIVAVTKTVGVAEIETIARLGIDAVGENRVQAALDKMAQVNATIEWHMIGTIQRRKVRDIVGRFNLVHSIDRVEVADEIQKRAEQKDVVVPALLEVNTSRETTKHGVDPEQVFALVEHVARLDRIKVRGLMTMAPLLADPNQARPCFAGLRECAERINAMSIPNIDMTELSMGMSNDYEVAVEEGATMVRIGTAIFGLHKG